jgi:hypothetical protein
MQHECLWGSLRVHGVPTQSCVNSWSSFLLQCRTYPVSRETKLWSTWRCEGPGKSPLSVNLGRFVLVVVLLSEKESSYVSFHMSTRRGHVNKWARVHEGFVQVVLLPDPVIPHCTTRALTTVDYLTCCVHQVLWSIFFFWTTPSKRPILEQRLLSENALVAQQGDVKTES